MKELRGLIDLNPGWAYALHHHIILSILKTPLKIMYFQIFLYHQESYTDFNSFPGSEQLS